MKTIIVALLCHLILLKLHFSLCLLARAIYLYLKLALLTPPPFSIFSQKKVQLLMLLTQNHPHNHHQTHHQSHYLLLGHSLSDLLIYYFFIIYLYFILVPLLPSILSPLPSVLSRYHQDHQKQP